jgi:hypothetical protein
MTLQKTVQLQEGGGCFMPMGVIRNFTAKKSKGGGEMRDVRTADDQEFLNRCRDELEELEKIRLVKLNIYEFRKKIGIPLAMIALPVCGFIDFWLLRIQVGNDNGIAGITFLVMGAIYAWVTSPRRQYANAYKEEILPDIARLFGDFQYSITGMIDMRSMWPSKIVPDHDNYDSEDYFRGEYKGVTIEFSEITLTERRGSGKNRRTVTVFKGLAILLDTKHKRFFGHTVLSQNQGKLGKWFQQRYTGLEHADLVDPEFEKIFDTYTNDQVEARYLIDPLMIEKLKGLYVEYEGEKMAAAFFDNKMLIMIASSHNHFEPASIYTPATDPQSILSMKHEIGEILSIIDKLSLYDPKAVQQQRTAATGTAG